MTEDVISHRNHSYMITASVMKDLILEAKFRDDL